MDDLDSDPTWAEQQIESLCAELADELFQYALAVVTDETAAREAVTEAFLRYALRLRADQKFDGGYK